MVKSLKKRKGSVSKTKEMPMKARERKSSSVSRSPSVGKKMRRKTVSKERKRKSSSEAGKQVFASMPEKRKRQYEHVLESEEKRGVPEKSAKKIAAATVNKCRKMHGETKS